MLNAFVSFCFNFEFDGKELCGAGLKAASETLFKGQDINQLLEMARQLVLGYGKNQIKPKIEELQLVDAVKAANVDDIEISIGFPQTENGIIHCLHLPGFSKAFVEKIFALVHSNG